MSIQNLFPTIGALADRTSNIDSSDSGTPIELDVGDNELESDKPIQEIESLCMQCGEQGITRLLLTSIPFFREVVLMSFKCQHCGVSNNEIQSAGTIQPHGSVHTARILARSDLNRQLVRSPTCTIRIPEFELTLPPARSVRGGGQLTTVEGLIREIVMDLNGGQEARKVEDMATWEGIEALLTGLRAILGDVEGGTGEIVHGKSGEEEKDREEKPLLAFTITLDDPAGNSFIEFVGNIDDPKWNVRVYERTRQDEIDLGLVDEQEVGPTGSEQSGVDGEVFVFPGTCSSCANPIETRMKKVVIPYFKDVLIMSTNCDRCGYRDNEVKSGSAISPQGKRITLKVEDREDLSRDILKSDTAALTIPEIDLTLRSGTLGGRFTTVEGILEQIYEELSQNKFTVDQADKPGQVAFEEFLSRLKNVKSASTPFTLILDDPLANSYIQSLYAPDPDPAITLETYERSWEQNEELGLNDMRVEGYGDEE